MRLDESTVRVVARNFRHGRGHAWLHVGPEIRRALLDAEVLDHIRAADSADNQTPVTPAQIMEFRAALEAYLRDQGVPRRGDQPHRFVI